MSVGTVRGADRVTAPGGLRVAATVALAVLLGACAEPAPPADPVAILLARTEGLTALQQDRLDEAEGRFRELVAMTPEESAGFGYLALVSLRRGRAGEAREWIDQGLELAPDDADLRLTLATALVSEGDLAAARAELEESVGRNLDHLPSLFVLAGLEESTAADPVAGARARAARLDAILELAPANLAVRLAAAESRLASGEPDPATAHLEVMEQQLPGMGDAAEAAFAEALALARSGDAPGAEARLAAFRDDFEVTGGYQAALAEVAPPDGELVGLADLTFSSQFTSQAADEETVLQAMTFTDGSGISGLEAIGAMGTAPVIVAADFDSDGDEDLFAAGADAAGAPVWRRLSVHLGLFEETDSPPVAERVGAARTAVAGDYDNDGHLDLFVAGDRGRVLLRNRGDGSLEDVTEVAGMAGAGGSAARAAAFADLDHDGDLDLFIAGDGPNAFLRNDGDGSFTEMAAAAGLAGDGDASGREVALADFDDDGDLDVFVARAGAPPALFTNDRGGRFREIGETAGLGGARGVSATVLDYDADGAFDLFLAGDGPPAILRNEGTGGFTVVRPWPTGLLGAGPATAEALDFDNDGRRDLVVFAGASPALLRNTGGRFEPVADKLPAGAQATALVVADYNQDGDADLLTASAAGLHLLRNDGGNVGNYMRLTLEGLAAGSGKNNRDGIGARVEVRADSLFQAFVVTGRTTLVGLGARQRAEVVRIEWTNGVRQDIYLPPTGGALEEQMLKGSCPMLFTWDGERYVFQKDVMWKSALGMPTGIMGNRGSRSYAPAGASREYVKIPGEAMAERDGRWSLRITEELWETFYLDEVKLLVVDHPESVEVFVDERFTPPAGPTPPEVHTVVERFAPVTAIDGSGRDLLPELLQHDDRYVSSLVSGEWQGVTEPHEVILDPGPAGTLDGLRLFLRGWTFPSDASINVAMAQAGTVDLFSPVVQVVDEDGSWVTVHELSFPAGKDKTLIADLRDAFPTLDRRVRVRTNMQIYWDEAFFAGADPGADPTITELESAEADLRYRGFSGTYRKGGRYGPHWFDYETVTEGPRWRDLTGRYTRYGDVRPILGDADDLYVIMNAGDEIAIDFDVAGAPPLPEGWSRDFLLYTVGWVKDGDLNTAAGQTVEPLPFHGMTRYPYGPEESYPMDEVRRSYLAEYNTRVVGGGGGR